MTEDKKAAPDTPAIVADHVEQPSAAESTQEASADLGATAAAVAAATAIAPPAASLPPEATPPIAATPVPATPAKASPPGPSARHYELPREDFPKQVYQASGVRKTILSLIFLLLLPFFISLPAMLYQRLTNQLWTDTIGFTIFASAFIIVMVLLVFELVHSIRSRVEINDKALKFTLPAASGAAMPKFAYRKHNIPFSDIRSVEMRREVYGGTMAPVLLCGARLITKDGEKIPLGFISEANVDPALPLPEIAHEVARRSGIEVTNRGYVRRALHKKLRGIQSLAETDGSIADAEVATLNRRHHNVVLAFCTVLVLLVASGILIDLTKSKVDLGERAPASATIPLKK